MLSILPCFTRQGAIWGFVGIVSVLLDSRCLAYEPLPIPTDKNAPAQRHYIARILKTYLRQVDEYQRHTTDPEPKRMAVANFIADLQRFYWLNRDDKTWEDFRKEGEALQAAGCDDPLFALNLRTVYRELGECTKERALFLKTHEAFEKSAYPPEWKMLAAREGLYVDSLWRKSNSLLDRAKIVDGLHQHALDLVRQNNFRDDDLRVAWNFLVRVLEVGDSRTNCFWPSEVKELSEALAEEKATDPWLRNMIQGKYYVREAFISRGFSYANEVKKEQWEGFVKNMLQAAEHFTKAWKLRPEFPEAASNMIAVAGAAGIGDVTLREWFDRSIAAQVDYGPAYDLYMNYLLPRWGGSSEELFDFGKECLATQRFETGVPWKLHNAIKLMHDYPETPRSVSAWKVPLYYPHLMLLYESAGKTRSPSDGPRRARTPSVIKTQAFWLAGNVNNEKDQKALVEKYGNELDDRMLTSLGFRPEVSKSSPFLALSNVGDEWHAFFKENINSHVNPPKAVETMDSLIRRCDDPRGLPSLKAWRRSFVNELQFYEGKWVDLTFDEPLLWRQHSPHTWTSEGPQSIVLRGTLLKEGPAFLQSTANFPGPLEIVLDVEQIENDDLPMRLGFYLGDYEGNEPKLVSRFFWCDEKLGEAGIGIPKIDPVGKKVKLQKVNHLHVYYWPDYHDVFVNGIWDDQQTEKFIYNGRILLGWMNWTANSGRARFSNLRIRKITTPSPTMLNPEERRKYYETVAIANPDYADANLRQAAINADAGDFDGATYHAERALRLLNDEMLLQQHTKTVEAYRAKIKAK